jgi:hypothetical protein
MGRASMLAKTAWDKAAKYAAKIAKTTDRAQVRFLIQMRNHWIEKANHLAALEERTTKRQRARVQQTSVSRSASPRNLETLQLHHVAHLPKAIRNASGHRGRDDCASRRNEVNEMRIAFLDMVIHWLAAGLKVDGLITPQTKSAASDARHWP